MDCVLEIRNLLNEYEGLKNELSKRQKAVSLVITFPSFEYFNRSEIDRIEPSLYKELLQLKQKYNSIMKDNSERIDFLSTRLRELESIIVSGISKIINNSTFDRAWLGNALSDVASTYLGEKYECITVESSAVPKCDVVILTNDTNKQYVLDELLNLREDQIVILGREKQLTFYTIKKSKNLVLPALARTDEIVCSVLKWDFLDEFVNMLISFRIEHEKEEITNEELEELKEEFYNAHIEKIKSNYSRQDKDAQYKIEGKKAEISKLEAGILFRKKSLVKLNKQTKQKKIGTIDSVQ